MLMDIMIREGRYAPGKLIPPKGEVLYWKLEHKDALGNVTASLECANVVELRFTKPAGSTSFILTVRGKLNEQGEGPEWTVVVPTERMGLLYLPAGFTTEQSIMGAVYRLSEARKIRILADQMVKMPGLNFTVQVFGA